MLWPCRRRMLRTPSSCGRAQPEQPVDRKPLLQSESLSDRAWHMIKYIALYKKAADEADSDEKYCSSHLPIVRKSPGLVRAEVAKVDRVLVPGFLGDTDLHVIAEMYFESAEVMKAAFQ